MKSWLIVLLGILGCVGTVGADGVFATPHWTQSKPYNDILPAYLQAGTGDVESLGGHVPAGCVATALGEVLQFWRWPRRFDTVVEGKHTVNMDGKWSFGVGQQVVPGVSIAYDETNESKARVSFIAATLAELAFTRDGSGGYVDKVVQKLVATGAYIQPMYDATTVWDRVEEMLRTGYPVPATIPGHAVVLDGWIREEGVVKYHLNYGWGEGSEKDTWVKQGELTAVYPLYPKKAAVWNETPKTLSPEGTVSWEFPEGFLSVYPKEFTGFELTIEETGVKATLEREARSYQLPKLAEGTYTLSLKPLFSNLSYLDPQAFIEATSVKKTIQVVAKGESALSLKAPTKFAASLNGCSFALTGSANLATLSCVTSLKTYTMDGKESRLADYIELTGKNGAYLVTIKPIDFLSYSDNYNVVFTFIGISAAGERVYAETIVNFAAENRQTMEELPPSESNRTVPPSVLFR